MCRCLAPFVAVLSLALPATALAAEGAFFAGDRIDGPSADINRLGDLDLARDGLGTVVYVKRDAGADHIFVSRLVGGTWQTPARVDSALTTASSQPVVAMSDGGRTVVAFISGGALWSTTRPSVDAPFTAIVQVAPVASDPAIDMSINGVAYLTYTAAGGDVRAARMERNGLSFNVLPDVLDIVPADVAGTGTGRSAVAVAADGIATVVWGEAGHVYGRRLFEMRLSTAPQDLALSSLGGATGGVADLPDISAEDDSSFAWVVFRQQIGGAPHALARRLVGSQFEPPAVIDGGEATDVPRISINGRGVGYAATDGLGGTAYGAVVKDDLMNGGIALGGGGGVPSLPVPAADETGDGAIAYQAADRSIHARAYDYVPASRAVTVPGPDTPLSRPEFGVTAADRGLLAAANRIGDIAIVFIQGDGAGRSVVGAAFDRLPGAFRSYAVGRWVRARPTFRWSQALEAWGAVSYEVQIDGRANGTTGATSLRVPTAIADGVHRWQIAAIDRRGQRRRTTSRTVLVDGSPPKVAVTLRGPRKRGAELEVIVRATDAMGRKVKASGVDSIKTSFGDATPAVAGKHVHHRYGSTGTRTIRVTVTDRAGNATVVRKQVRIHA